MTVGALRSRYSYLSISLHWLMLILLVAVYACMELREYYPKGSEFREGLKTWHFMLGLTVLLLLIVRIIARAMGSTPPIAPDPPAWQARFAKIAHIALYVFMFAMPIAGWVILSASGKAIPFFLFDLPPLVGPNKALAAQVKYLHETVATIGYYIIGLHALAALFHHYLLKDNTLRRMMPGVR
jgi:superoxide oxidase